MTWKNRPFPFFVYHKVQKEEELLRIDGRGEHNWFAASHAISLIRRYSYFIEFKRGSSYHDDSAMSRHMKETSVLTEEQRRAAFISIFGKMKKI